MAKPYEANQLSSHNDQYYPRLEQVKGWLQRMGFEVVVIGAGDDQE